MADSLHKCAGFGQQLLDDTGVAGTIKPALAFNIGLGEDLYRSRLCLKKVALRLFCVELAKLLGNLEKEVLAKVKPDGKVHWMAVGPFAYEFQSGASAEPLLSKIVRNRSDTEVYLLSHSRNVPEIS